MPKDADVIITTDSEVKKAHIQRTFGEAGITPRVIRVVKNRGRELRALLSDCRDLLPEYDIICFLHDKKSGQDGLPVGESYRHILFDNTLCSPEYVENIINLFHNEPRLGLLGVPRPMMGGYIGSVGVEWLSEFETARNLLKRMRVQVPVLPDRQPFCISKTPR